MITATLERALKSRKPAIIKEKGAPRYVVLDWKTYRAWEEDEDDLGNTIRLTEALADKKNRKHTSLSRVKKMLNIHTKKLGGVSDGYRTRVGRWRILFTLKDREIDVADIFLKKGRSDYRSGKLQ